MTAIRGTPNPEKQRQARPPGHTKKQLRRAAILFLVTQVSRARNMSAEAEFPALAASGGETHVSRTAQASWPCTPNLSAKLAYLYADLGFGYYVDHALYYRPSVGATALLLRWIAAIFTRAFKRAAPEHLERLTCQTQRARRPPINSHNHPKGG